MVMCGNALGTSGEPTPEDPTGTSSKMFVEQMDVDGQVVWINVDSGTGQDGAARCTINRSSVFMFYSGHHNDYSFTGTPNMLLFKFALGSGTI